MGSVWSESEATVWEVPSALEDEATVWHVPIAGVACYRWKGTGDTDEATVWQVPSALGEGHGCYRWAHG